MTNGIAHWLSILTPFIVLAGQLYAKRDRKAKQANTLEIASAIHAETLEKVDEVHTLVNSAADAQEAKIVDLKSQLIDAGVPIKDTPK